MDRDVRARNVRCLPAGTIKRGGSVPFIWQTRQTANPISSPGLKGLKNGRRRGREGGGEERRLGGKKEKGKGGGEGARWRRGEKEGDGGRLNYRPGRKSIGLFEL